MRYGETVRVRVPAEIAAWVRQRAEQEGRTISKIVREAVDAYLSETSPQEDKDEEDDSAALAIRLTPGQRAALRARGNLERLIRCALRAYHAAPPPPKRAPSAAVGPNTHDYFVRLTSDMRAEVRRQAARHRTSEAAIIRFALQCAAR